MCSQLSPKNKIKRKKVIIKYKWHNADETEENPISLKPNYRTKKKRILMNWIQPYYISCATLFQKFSQRCAKTMAKFQNKNNHTYLPTHLWEAPRHNFTNQVSKLNILFYKGVDENRKRKTQNLATWKLRVGIALTNATQQTNHTFLKFNYNFHNSIFFNNKFHLHDNQKFLTKLQ